MSVTSNILSPTIFTTISEHDTGKQIGSIAYFDGDWIVNPGQVRITVDDGLVQATSAETRQEILARDGRISIERLQLKAAASNMLRWENRETREVVLWVRDNALNPFEGLLQIVAPGQVSVPVKQEHRIKQEPVDEFNSERKVDSTVTIERQVKLLNGVKFPELADIDFLGHHIKSIESLLRDYKLMTQYVVPTFLQVGVCNKFLETLKLTDKVKQVTLNHLRTRGTDWLKLRTTLSKTFCNREVLTVSYRRRILNLQFHHTSKVEEFLMEASAIHALLLQIYGEADSAERRTLVKDILSKLPEFIRRNVILRLRRARQTVDEDWELAIPFAPNYDSETFTRDDVPDNSLLSLIEEECLAAEQAQLISTNVVTTTKHRSDQLLATERMPTKHIDSKKWFIGGEIPDVSVLERLGLTNVSKAISRVSKKEYALADGDDSLDTLQRKLAAVAPKAKIEHRRPWETKNSQRGQL